MTERDLYISCIPIIAEIIARCSRLSRSEYEDWKRETMEHCPETVKELISKTMIVIDKSIEKMTSR